MRNRSVSDASSSSSPRSSEQLHLAKLVELAAAAPVKAASSRRGLCGVHRLPPGTEVEHRRLDPLDEGLHPLDRTEEAALPGGAEEIEVVGADSGEAHHDPGNDLLSDILSREHVAESRMLAPHETTDGHSASPLDLQRKPADELAVEERGLDAHRPRPSEVAPPGLQPGGEHERARARHCRDKRVPRRRVRLEIVEGLDRTKLDCADGGHAGTARGGCPARSRS